MCHSSFHPQLSLAHAARSAHREAEPVDLAQALVLARKAGLVAFGAGGRLLDIVAVVAKPPLVERWRLILLVCVPRDEEVSPLGQMLAIDTPRSQE